MLQAIVEQIKAKHQGIVEVGVRCPICQDIHYHGLGIIFKKYTFPKTGRFSRCPLHMEYQLV